MALVQEFGYAVYGVPDLEESVDFFRTICQLEVSERREDVAAEAQAIVGALEDAPKGKRFRMRARIGERKRWYELPEETPHDD